MNERIKLLAEQASEDTRIKHNNAYWRMADESPEDATWKEKFAKLIVKECINIADDYVNDGSTFDRPRKSLIGKEIAKHFGVE